MTSYLFYSIWYAYRFFTRQKNDSIYRCARLTEYRCARLTEYRCARLTEYRCTRLDTSMTIWDDFRIDHTYCADHPNSATTLSETLSASDQDMEDSRRPPRQVKLPHQCITIAHVNVPHARARHDPVDYILDKIDAEWLDLTSVQVNNNNNDKTLFQATAHRYTYTNTAW